MIPFDTGLMSIDAHNCTRTSREGYIADEDYDSLPTLEKHLTKTDADQYEHYTRLRPGLYKHNMNGQDYALMIHDEYLKGDELIIKNRTDVFGIVNVVKKPIRPYILHRGYEYDEDNGVQLNYTCNDHLNIIVINGKSNLIMDHNEREQYFTHPAEIKSTSMLRASVINENGSHKEYLLNLKSYIKSIELNYTYNRNAVHDKLFLDSEQNKATYEYNIGMLRLTGFENFNEINNSEDPGMLIVSLEVPQMKNGSNLVCSHYITTSEELILSGGGYVNAVASSSSDHKIYFMTNRVLFNDHDSFKTNLIREYEAGHPVTLLYEYDKPKYQTIILNNYYIDLSFNKSWIKLGLYNGSPFVPDKQSNDFIIQLPENTEHIESDASIKAAYFYKHFRDWRV